MRLEYVPLLQKQQDLYRVPRGMDRFREYLRTMVNDHGDDLEIPALVAINPMARDHVPILVDEYLALDADGQAALAIAALSESLADVPGEFKVSLVMLDDLKGLWTNRYAAEYAIRCGEARTNEKSRRRQSWLTGALWSSEPATLKTAREQVLLAVLRAAYRHENGVSRTLGEILAQEGHCLERAGCTHPTLDPDDLNYSRDVIAPLLDESDMATAIACLFGDLAARTLGFTPRGLSEKAGLALALHDARACKSAAAV